MLNKKGVGEGFSWAAGLIAILVIIILSYVAYTFGHVGAKNPVTISSEISSYSFGFNRIVPYLISSDFNSSRKGEILYKFYDNTIQTPGGAAHYPQLPRSSLSYVIYADPSFRIPAGFYLSCRACLNKYLEISYAWRSRNAIKF